MAARSTDKNLVAIKKGQVLNPNGRPKGSRNRSTIAREILSMKGALPEDVFKRLKAIFPEINNKMSIEEIMSVKMTQQAITKGDVTAYKAIMDSAYGSPNQSISGPNEGPIETKRKLTLEELKKEAEERGLPTSIFKQNE